MKLIKMIIACALCMATLGVHAAIGNVKALPKIPLLR